jgi:hypothetical protein
MPRQLPPSELDSLVRSIEQHDTPVGASELNRLLPYAMELRTLQRRLALLVRQGRVVSIGEGPARRYQVARTGSTMPVAEPGEVYDASRIPLSSAALKIKAYVHQPLTRRIPVGYDRTFLDSYRPNETWYLPRTTREHLGYIGKAFGNTLPEGTYARQILQRLLIDLSWNSSRLEGNAYSLLETERLMEHGEEAAGKDVRDAQMLLNHRSAITFVVEHASEMRFNPHTILNLHAILADNLIANPRAMGALRTIAVGVGRTVYEPLFVPHVIEECFRQILHTTEAIEDPFEQSFFALVHLSYLQGFEDVNKRLARLSANIPFIRQNLIPLSFVDVPREDFIDGILGVYERNRYELLRDVYVWAYERSCARYRSLRQSAGEPDPLRLSYRRQIGAAVRAVVTQRVRGRQGAEGTAAQFVGDIPEVDRQRVIALVVAELEYLHEGNIARYQINLPMYCGWRDGMAERKD